MDSPALTLDLPDLAATLALGAKLGAQLGRGDVVTLAGPLGAGKTMLARAAIRARTGAPELEIPSPTFTLVQTYEATDDGPDDVSIPGGLEIWHADLYRLEQASGVAELGLEEAFAQAAVLVEWPDRLGPFLPPERLEIDLAYLEEGARRAVLTGHGGRWRGRLEQLGAEFDRTG